MDAQVDLSFRWAHMSEGTFSHVVTHVVYNVIFHLLSSLLFGPRSNICGKQPPHILLCAMRKRIQAYADGEVPDQPAHPCILIRAFTVR